MCFSVPVVPAAMPAIIPAGVLTSVGAKQLRKKVSLLIFTIDQGFVVNVHFTQV